MAKEIAKKNYRVVFSGSGSDEVFCSYPNERRWCWGTDESFDNARRRLVQNLHKNNLIRENKCMMSQSQEIRSPFLHKGFVELGLNSPPQYREENKRMKPLLRLAFQDILPPEILWREKTCEGEGVDVDRIIKPMKDEIKSIYRRIFRA